MTTYRLGINTCFAVKRWPEPSAWSAIVRDRFGLELVQHSLDLVSLGPGIDEARQVAELKAASSAAGLEIGSTFTGLAAYSTNLLLDPRSATRTEAMAWYERVIDFSAAIGARAAGGHVGAFSVADWHNPAARAERWDELQRQLAHLSSLAHDRGLTSLLIENMAAEREPATIEQIEQLMRDGSATAAPIRLCLDVGHQCVAGSVAAREDPYRWLEQLGARTPIVHLQQSDLDGDHHWPFTAEHNAGGRIDADRVLEALDRSGAEHVDLILEVIHPFEAPDDQVLDELEESAGYWHDALGRHG